MIWYANVMPVSKNWRCKSTMQDQKLDKKLSCRTNAARASCHSASLNISVSHSRPFEMIPLSRSRVSAYWYCNCFYLVPFPRYSASNNGMTIEIWVRGHSRSLKMAPFYRSHTSSYGCSIVTMALSCITSVCVCACPSHFLSTRLQVRPLNGFYSW